ncbi:MAG: AAA family ATPase [Phycisphaerales bacterium]|nr:AAA family ATPase [Phycisphaerales bacterium]
MSDRLVNLMLARHPCLRIVTTEETEAVEWVVRSGLTAGLAEAQVWTVLEGWRRARSVGLGIPGTEDPAAGLYHAARKFRAPALLILLDSGAHLDDPRVRRGLRELIEEQSRLGGCVVLIDHEPGPPAVQQCGALVELPLPEDKELHDLVVKELRAWPGLKITMSKNGLKQVVEHLRGLSARAAAQVIRDVIASDRDFSPEDLPRVIEAKRRLVGAGGLLEFVEAPTSMDEIGGLARLKAWLAARQDCWKDSAREFGLPMPRGMLLLGVQGAGKSLCAKAVATAWKRPLLRMDPGVLYDRFIGESERRLRDALSQAEAMAPIVLWIDEVEKAFASAASQSVDGGLSQRMFGTLLTWLQEHKSSVFAVATANNIDALPPELMRKGRFDEIFFVDLPGEEARRMIFEIHLRKRGRDPAMFDIAALAAASHGRSGAEIEQAVISGLHEAYAGKQTLETEGLLRAVASSPPLSITMAERVLALRQWAKTRCVPAD